MPDNDNPAGATPAAAGATPTQTTPVSPAADSPATAPTLATGDPDALGDPGKRALDVMKAERNAASDRAKAAEAELEKLRNATASDTDKALAKAKADGAAEVTAKWTAQVRRSEVKSALTGAGINASVLDLAVNAAEFASLKVTDDGEVDGLQAAIDSFRKAKPDLFTKPATPGTADGGTHGTPSLTREQIAKMTPDQINGRWEEVSRALATAK